MTRHDDPSPRRPRRTPTRHSGWQGTTLKRDHAPAATGIPSRQRNMRLRTCLSICRQNQSPIVNHQSPIDQSPIDQSPIVNR
jgi:hypothetical protein